MSTEKVRKKDTKEETVVVVKKRERESFNLRKKEKNAQKSCVYLRYKDRLCKVVCLFGSCNSS